MNLNFIHHSIQIHHTLQKLTTLETHQPNNFTTFSNIHRQSDPFTMTTATNNYTHSLSPHKNQKPTTKPQHIPRTSQCAQKSFKNGKELNYYLYKPNMKRNWKECANYVFGGWEALWAIKKPTISVARKE